MRKHKAAAKVRMRRIFRLSDLNWNGIRPVTKNLANRKLPMQDEFVDTEKHAEGLS
jgi:hypothetical protein